jgi:hypothetical protein
VNLCQRLHEYGLFARGVTRLTAAEIETWGFAADKPALVLVGNIGSSYWPIFSQSAEYLDGAADPLDRWSQRVANEIAAELPVQPVYPFAGPPYYPFQQWAQRAEALEQSPIGVMMHPEFGLWHSYRFALLGAEFDAPEKPLHKESPCLSCATQPCLHRWGCLARYACPVATELNYLPEQGKFHLAAFLNARK